MRGATTKLLRGELPDPPLHIDAIERNKPRLEPPAAPVPQTSQNMDTSLTPDRATVSWWGNWYTLKPLLEQTSTRTRWEKKNRATSATQEVQKVVRWETAVSAMQDLRNLFFQHGITTDRVNTALREISCLPFDWPMCKITFNVTVLYRQVTRLYRAEMLERTLREGEREAWAWLEDVRPQILMHFAAQIARTVTHFLLPAQDFAVEMHEELQCLFTSSFWYRQIMTNMADLQYGNMRSQEMLQRKQEHESTPPVGLVKLLFDTTKENNSILLCKVNRIQFFVPTAIIQPLVEGHGFEVTGDRAKFSCLDHSAPYWTGMSMLTLNVTWTRPLDCLPDIRQYFPACQEAFAEGILNDTAACLFINSTTTKCIQIPVYHADLLKSKTAVPKTAMPMAWATNWRGNVSDDDTARHITHHEFLTSLNMDPITLSIVSTSGAKTLESIFMSHRRLESRYRLEHIWADLYTDYEYHHVTDKRPLTEQDRRDLVTLRTRFPPVKGFELTEPYQYLTHLTPQGIEIGRDIYEVPTPAALAAAPPAAQKRMIGFPLFERLFLMSPHHATFLANKLLFGP